MAFITQIEQLRVTPDQVARVIIEEASGTIVMGEQVRVSTVAIAQGNLTIRITETPQVSQPNALANGETVVVPRTQIEVDDQGERRMGVLRGGVTLSELVRGLNSLGVGPRDLITILQSIKAAGALQAELETPARMRQTAQAFEAQVLAQLMQPAFDTVDSSKSAFGGGSAEAQWRPMLVEAFATGAARSAARSAIPPRPPQRAPKHRSHPR
eukprot:gene6396-7948_t